MLNPSILVPGETNSMPFSPNKFRILFYNSEKLSPESETGLS